MATVDLKPPAVGPPARPPDEREPVVCASRLNKLHVLSLLYRAMLVLFAAPFDGGSGRVNRRRAFAFESGNETSESRPSLEF